MSTIDAVIVTATIAFFIAGFLALIEVQPFYGLALWFIGLFSPERPDYPIERIGPADRLDGVDWEPSDEDWFSVSFRGKRPITSEPAGLDTLLAGRLITEFARMECGDLRLEVARLERQLQRSRTRHKKASLLVRDLRRAIATLQLEEVGKAHRASQWANFFDRMFTKRREAA